MPGVHHGQGGRAHLPATAKAPPVKGEGGGRGPRPSAPRSQRSAMLISPPWMGRNEPPVFKKKRHKSLGGQKKTKHPFSIHFSEVAPKNKQTKLHTQNPGIFFWFQGWGPGPPQAPPKSHPGWGLYKTHSLNHILGVSNGKVRGVSNDFFAEPSRGTSASKTLGDNLPVITKSVQPWMTISDLSQLQLLDGWSLKVKVKADG